MAEASRRNERGQGAHNNDGGRAAKVQSSSRSSNSILPLSSNSQRLPMRSSGPMPFFAIHFPKDGKSNGTISSSSSSPSTKANKQLHRKQSQRRHLLISLVRPAWLLLFHSRTINWRRHGLFHLLANGDPVTLLEQLVQVCFKLMVRKSRHWQVILFGHG